MRVLEPHKSFSDYGKHWRSNARYVKGHEGDWHPFFTNPFPNL